MLDESLNGFALVFPATVASTSARAECPSWWRAVTGIARLLRTNPTNARSLHPCKHSLLAQALDRVRRALARVLSTGFNHVDEHVILERGQRGTIGTEIEPEAEVDRLQIEGELVAGKCSDKPTGVGGNHECLRRNGSWACMTCGTNSGGITV